MAAAQAVHAQPTGVVYELCSDEVELLWEMGIGQFTANGTEFVIPLEKFSKLEEPAMKELQIRFSALVKGPTIAFVDEENSVWRMMRTPVFNAKARASHVGDDCIVDVEITNAGSYKSVEASGSNGSGKKTNVPRPSNSWILFRQYWHPKVMAELPKGAHNNQVSKILSAKWKAESEENKNFWKAEAERKKAEHYLLHPDYVYAPRKPGQKKKRNTTRKSEANTAAVKALLQYPGFGSYKTISATSNTFKKLDNGKVEVTVPAEPGVFLDQLHAHNDDLGFVTSGLAPTDLNQFTISSGHIDPEGLALFDYELFANDMKDMRFNATVESTEIEEIDSNNEILSLVEDEEAFVLAELDRMQGAVDN